ncbi:AbrB/MazE/SpoVT family DNA-binding domain-containing protein [Candidatus Pacearchaeota archaeon]|nr:AbrB/MazE/SpoVT family DNA-binding domain-containing protein [Candidatus Pacearchaeota archaeon]
MSEQIGVSKVSANMNIAIPKKVQEKLGGLDKGQYILFFEEKGRICIKKGTIKLV